MEETKTLLRRVFQTRNALTLPVSGTGSAGMETCFVNLVEPGDEVVIGVNGVFGTRMADVVERCDGTRPGCRPSRSAPRHRTRCASGNTRSGVGIWI